MAITKTAKAEKPIKIRIPFNVAELLAREFMQLLVYRCLKV